MSRDPFNVSQADSRRRGLGGRGLRWRCLRWAALAAIVPALWACSARKLVAPVGGPSQVIKKRFVQSVNRDLDLLFVVDDSKSMLPLQAKMAARLPDFMNVFKPGGLPNLHVAVISSSLGAGAAGDVPGCRPNTVGNTNGAFQHRGACTMLHAGQTFISSVADPEAPGGRVNNFEGDIADVFTCIASIGDEGCGFEHQFDNTRLALEKAKTPGDPDNGGFLRPEAYLAIVMVTNEDDCSVPVDSMLFDPGVQRLADVSAQPGRFQGVALGGLQSYRCNEFGHLCGGMKPPHNPPTTNTTLSNCVSAEDGVLTKVSDFVSFLKGLKEVPSQVLVAAIAGPVAPYIVGTTSTALVSGGGETQPAVMHSCTQATADPNVPEYADPGIRIKQWLDAFPNSVMDSICANDFAPAMTNIANVIRNALDVQCVEGTILTTDAGAPDCDVTQRTFSTANPAVASETFVPSCAPGRAGTDATHPCWELQPSAACLGGQALQVCYDVGCTIQAKPTSRTDALVACAVMP